jgi:hypothetical protein
MTITIAIAGNHVFDGIGHLVGGVADAILEPVCAFGYFVVRALSGARCVISRFAQFVTHVVAALVGRGL